VLSGEIGQGDTVVVGAEGDEVTLVTRSRVTAEAGV
jgi:hypothetical protein